jgi:hypothetical protein
VAVADAIGACDGDLIATIRSLVVANNFLLAQNQALRPRGPAIFTISSTSAASPGSSKASATGFAFKKPDAKDLAPSLY